jgi:diguanylate cyclase (GGDEF)-like protein/PAS domain S-box-containing protein
VTSEGRNQARPTRWRRVGHWPLAAGLVLLLCAATTVAGLVIDRAYEGRKETIVQRFNTRHTTASRFIEAYLRQIVAQQLRLARQSLSGAVIRPADFDDLARLNQFATATLYDGDGALIDSYPAESSGTGSVRRQDGGLESALGGVPAVTAVTARGSGDTPLIAFAVNYQTSSGPRVFAGRYPVEDTLLQSFVANALPTYRTAHMYLVNSAGTVIVADRRDSSGLDIDQVAPDLAGFNSTAHHGFLPQLHQYYVSGPIEGTTWRLTFSLDSAELYQTLTPGQKYWPWATLAGFFAMGLGMIALFVRALADRTKAIDDHERQEAILETAGDAFIGTDDTGLVTDWNSAAVKLLGWTPAETIGQPMITKLVAPADREEFASRLRAFLETGVASGPQPISITAQHRDGHQIPIEATIARSHWQGSWRFHTFMRDVTERLENERRLQEMALTDSLTGLANRRAFLEQLDQAHSRTVRHGTRLAVLYGDVDHFKAINDSYGHAAGDAVLRQVAARLRSHFRTEDTVGRLGGDEFAVICEDFTPDSAGLLERLREVLTAPYSFRDQTIQATVSVGLASPQAGESSAHLLERADSTMYRAKAAR